MTVHSPKIKTHLKTIEISAGRIEVKLDKGTLVDDDVGHEGRGLPTVDFFIMPFDTPDDGKVIVRSDSNETRQNKFLADAKKWGSVREELAETEELDRAQKMFYFGYSVAERVIREFSRALDNDGVSQDTQGQPNFVTLAYTSPRGEAMTCTAYYVNGAHPGDPRRLVSISIQDTIGGPNSDKVRIDVSDPAIINRLRSSLEPVIQRP